MAPAAATSSRSTAACLLLDCGNGVFSKLRRFVDYIDVDAVVISHLHADHILDLVPFASALTYAPRQQPVPGRPLAGHRQPGAPRACTCRGGPRRAAPDLRRGRDAEEHVERAFDLHEYAPDDVVEVEHACACAFTACRTSCPRAPSTSPSTNGGGRFTYGADSAPNDELVRFADGTDPAHDRGDAAAPRARGPARAPHAVGGRRARQQGARAPARADPHLRRARLRTGPSARPSRPFGGPVDVAVEGAVFNV
jgi:ribonuclease BN (tRNA processing enzyme)